MSFPYKVQSPSLNSLDNHKWNVYFSEVYFHDLRASKMIPIRDVKAEYIGRLVTIRGVVMRLCEVKPMMVVATYSCDMCGAETYKCVRYYT